MTCTHTRWCFVAGFLAAAVLTIPVAFAAAQATPVPAPAPEDGVEVLAQGPVHEAYASTAEPVALGSVVVPKMPPDPIEELPPDQKPEGDNVTWIPGYWQWDEDRSDFIWVSGFWRIPPPGRVWIPGSWREVRGGWQWTSGFWQVAVSDPSAAAGPVAELEYLPAPPDPLEMAPSVPAPNESSFYVPGCWVYREKYVWRPGYWVDYQPNWVWVPAHYCWTPAGYVFVDGYWDYPLPDRGVLFAPVYLTQGVIARPAYVYTPTYVVPFGGLITSLFVRRGVGHYYFGDYFEPRYVNSGYTAFSGVFSGTNFAITIGLGRGYAYDHNWGYFQYANRGNPNYLHDVTNLYTGRYRGNVPRPPRTLVQQNTVVNNITNVTNNVPNVSANSVRDSLSMVAPLQTISRQGNSGRSFRSVPQAERVREQQLARETRQVATQRQRTESNIVSRDQIPMKPGDAPRKANVEVSRSFYDRSQIPHGGKSVPAKPAHQGGGESPADRTGAREQRQAPRSPQTPNPAAVRPQPGPAKPPAPTGNEQPQPGQSKKPQPGPNPNQFPRSPQGNPGRPESPKNPPQSQPGNPVKQPPAQAPQNNRQPKSPQPKGPQPKGNPSPKGPAAVQPPTGNPQPPAKPRPPMGNPSNPNPMTQPRPMRPPQQPAIPQAKPPVGQPPRPQPAKPKVQQQKPPQVQPKPAPQPQRAQPPQPQPKPRQSQPMKASPKPAKPAPAAPPPPKNQGGKGNSGGGKGKKDK